MQITKSVHRVASAAASCKACLFFVAAAHAGTGSCRRYPPAFVPNYAAQWPQVAETEACGEFQPSAGWQ